MAIALVGTIGVASQGASGAAVTPAWGTGENGLTGNLLVCFVSVTGVATLPTTPANWSIAKQLAGTSCSATVYWKAGTGADAAPTIAAITSGVIAAQLAEFSGANVAAVDQSGSAAATTSLVTATFGGADAATSELLAAASGDFRSVAKTPSDTWTSNHVTAVTAAGNNNGSSSVNHYSFGYGLTNSISGADTAILTISTTTSLTGAAVAAATFKVGSPVSPAPTALALTFTGATPTVATTANVLASPSALALTFAGGTPAVATPITTSPTALALTLTGATPAVSLPVAVAPSALAMSLTGATPTVALPVVIAPSALALAFAGAVPTVSTPDAIAPAPLALTWTGAVPTVSTPISVNPAALALALAFATPDVAVTTGQAVSVTPDSLALSWAGWVPYVGTGGDHGGVMGGGMFVFAQPPARNDPPDNENARRLIAALLEEDALDTLEII